jgi:hypothetical protein
MLDSLQKKKRKKYIPRAPFMMLLCSDMLVVVAHSLSADNIKKKKILPSWSGLGCVHLRPLSWATCCPHPSNSSSSCRYWACVCCVGIVVAVVVMVVVKQVQHHVTTDQKKKLQSSTLAGGKMLCQGPSATNKQLFATFAYIVYMLISAFVPKGT